MVYLINTAMADNQLHAEEEKNLRHIAQSLNFSHLAFEKLLDMIRAQGSFSGGSYYDQQQNQKPKANELKEAYTALGVSPDTSDRDIKKAYRKLMSEYHPDKLIGQGVPDDMVKLATERSQEVQTAYDIIKKARKNH
jgi:DnaJ like chaperone protein